MITLVTFLAPRPDARVAEFFRAVTEAAALAWKPGDPGQPWPVQRACGALGAELVYDAAPGVSWPGTPHEQYVLTLRDALELADIDVTPYRERLCGQLREIRAEWREIGADTPERFWAQEFERIVRARLSERQS